MRLLWSTIRADSVVILELVRMAGAFRVRGRPYPSRELVAWRIATAYGSSSAKVSPTDLVAFLRWRRRFRAVTP